MDLSEKVKKEVTVIDDDHVYINGSQFVSLTRFFENRSEIAKEYKLITEDNSRLAAENEHLKALLKNSL